MAKTTKDWVWSKDNRSDQTPEDYFMDLQKRFPDGTPVRVTLPPVVFREFEQPAFGSRVTIEYMDESNCWQPLSFVQKIKMDISAVLDAGLLKFDLYEPGEENESKH